LSVRFLCFCLYMYYWSYGNWEPSACISAAYYTHAWPVAMFGCRPALCSIVSVLSWVTACCWLSL